MWVLGWQHKRIHDRLEQSVLYSCVYKICQYEEYKIFILFKFSGGIIIYSQLTEGKYECKMYPTYLSWLCLRNTLAHLCIFAIYSQLSWVKHLLKY